MESSSSFYVRGADWVYKDLIKIRGMRKGIAFLAQHVGYVGCQKGPENLDILDDCVVPRCQSVRPRAPCGPKCPFQRVSHEFWRACDD